MKSTKKTSRLTRTDKAWIDGYFEGYESGVQSLHKFKEEVISAWKDKDEFELIAHLRKLARLDEKQPPEKAYEFEVLFSYYRETYIKTGGQKC